MQYKPNLNQLIQSKQYNEYKILYKKIKYTEYKILNTKYYSWTLQAEWLPFPVLVTFFILRSVTLNYGCDISVFESFGLVC